MDPENILVENFNIIDILHSKYFEYYKVKERFKKLKNQFSNMMKPDTDCFGKNSPTDSSPLFGTTPPSSCDWGNVVNDEAVDLSEIMKDAMEEENPDIKEQETPSPSSKSSRNKNRNDYKSDRIKKLYRKISMKSHPDKTSNPKLNKIFLSAKKYYDKNNLVKMFILTKFIGLEEDLEDEDIVSIRDGVKKYEQKISDMEGSVIWKWGNMNESERTKFYNLNRNYFKEDVFK